MVHITLPYVNSRLINLNIFQYPYIMDIYYMTYMPKQYSLYETDDILGLKFELTWYNIPCIFN